MAYSRWGGSRWYTFWFCQDDETENRETSIFEVCCVASFTAAELRENITRCLDESVAIEKDQFGTNQPLRDDDRDELRGYFAEFLADVDEAYPSEVK